jgi:hypothetical protein
MAMLTELQNVRQTDAEFRRRWFSSPDMDLIVWYGEAEEPEAFELYYDKTVAEHVLAWRKDSGYSHLAVDDGEQKPALNYKQTPILIADGTMDARRIGSVFADAAVGLPAELLAFVLAKIRQHPQYLRQAAPSRST